MGTGHWGAEDPFMERLPWVDVTCCKHGNSAQKATRLALKALPQLGAQKSLEVLAFLKSKITATATTKKTCVYRTGLFSYG